MREPKPYWRDVPIELRNQIEVKVGSSIRRATRVFGGYGPSATFRFFLEDGRTVFAKGAGLGSIAENWRVLPLEEAVYRDIAAIYPMSPRYFGSVSVDGWHLLLLEDLRNTKKVPPWSEKFALKAVRDIAEFHLRGLSEAGKVETMTSKGVTENWFNIKNNNDERNYFLEMFQEKRREAELWLEEVIDILISKEAELMNKAQPWGLIHKDIRSDNLRFRDGSLILFDWALACRGPLLFDVGFFLPSIEGEGGPAAEHLLPEYKRVMADNNIYFSLVAEQSVAVAVAGFFASRAGKPPIPLLPRLRYIQRLQLGPALRWSCNILGLPQPPTLNFNE
ncbi:aminoglycoside phosphotransferase family protein [Neobacillus pocheonensis]|uniref:Aminoglycoside phosphotransferase family protein n=1 Tax=Neobacillus pocheonensis TaxID=363869 RepID=A0ABT0WEW5_9BACI|nr:aminoglycoside phosphotransferase family protein [Neobacillus pocheonensis]